MLQNAADVAEIVANLLLSKAQDAFLAVGGPLSLTQLSSAFLIALTSIFLVRRAKGKRIKARAFVKAFFARRLVFSRSSKADYALVILNVFMGGLLFGWAVISHSVISAWAYDALVAGLGARAASGLPVALTTALATIALFLAYEFAYWTDHFLSHKTFLWEFHKVHHQAETLTPATNFRVHPVDSIVFYNILALCTGVTQGVCGYVFGTVPSTFSGNNLIFLFFAYTLTHLQHSHVWIAFTGFWGRVILSPAHHQIHHSRNPIHFDRNFGSNLAVFDWLFGTLHVPLKEREPLTFGVEADGCDPHSVTGTLVAPFVRAGARLQPTRAVESARGG